MNPNLLIIYTEIPGGVYQFIINPKNKNYNLFKQMHGCIINSNSEKSFSEEIINFICGEEFGKYIRGNLYEYPPMELNGVYVVIHCGFNT